jgi:hypothetical protein
VDLHATDGSDIAFRLYETECHWRTPATRGWIFRVKGGWRE